MGRQIDISGLDPELQAEIMRIANKPRVVDISGLSNDDQHNVMKVVLADKIQIVRQGLRERKRV